MYETVETVRVASADLAALLRERDALRAQVTALQEDATRRLEESLPRRVRAFHAKFGHPNRTTPTIPSDEEVRFRMRLILEEAVEFLDACLDHEKNEGSSGARWRAFIASAVIKLDLPAAYDALIDLAYVIEGTHASFGTEAKPGLDEVQRAKWRRTPTGRTGSR